MPLNDKKLIQLRLAKKVSQNEVAKCLNISQATISYIESGKHADVRINQVEMLAEFYGVTIHYLLDYVEPDYGMERMMIERAKENLLLSLEAINKLMRRNSEKATIK
jgi:transcriptional regulator with XRE-family HTH domain